MKYFRLALQLYYFDKGYGLSHYIFKMIALFGLASEDVMSTLTLGILYAIFCYALGRWAYLWGFAEAQTEVNNKVDPFVKEMRKRNP